MKLKEYSLSSRIARTEAIYEALGEAAYEGNLGISEVASFYMNAEPQQIAQFEAAMDSGDETAAWDIVQNFTGTNLVGIGSDIEADSDISRQVAESFRRDRKVLSVDMLYQYVADSLHVLREGKVPGGRKEIVDDLIKHFAGDYPDAEPKLYDQTKTYKGINNLGGRFERKDFAEKAKEYLTKKYNLEDSDVTLEPDKEGVIRKLDVEGIKITLHQGGGGGREATRFESNLLLALLGGKHGDKTFKSFGDKINQDMRWQNAADAVVAGLKNPSGAPAYASPMPAVNPQNTSKSSGGGIEVTLTDTYTKWGAVSTEAKADLLINGIGTSVKKKEESQFMSTQGPECAAVFDVVMKKHPQLTQEMSRQTDVFLEQLKRVMGTTKNIDSDLKGASAAVDAYVNADDPASDLEKNIDSTFKDDNVGANKGMSQAVRARIAKDMEDNWDNLSPETKATIAGTKKDGTAKDPTEKKLAVVAQKQLTQLLYIDCGGEIDPTEKKIFDTAVKNAGVAAAEPFVDMANSLKAVLDTDTFRVGVMKEGLTGDGKFATESAKAKAILKWSVGSPESSYWVDLMDGDSYNDAVFTQIASGLKLGIRDRGSGRGLAMRGDAIASQACKADEINESDVDELLPLVSAERLNLSVVSDWSFTEEQQAQIQSDANTIYESVIRDELLTEQIMEGWFTDLLDKGVDVVSRGAKWVKDTFKKVMKLISESIAKLANWFKDVLTKSFSTFMKAFGFEPENSTIEIPMP